MIKNWHTFSLKFHLLTVLTGMASSVCLYIWFREFMLFFGTHAVSSSTIISSVLILIALGSRLTGIMADKTKNRPVILIVLTSVALVYTVCHRWLFSLMTVLFYKINDSMHPGPFGIELLRLLLSFVLLLIPVFCMAGVFIVLIRHSIRHTSQSGKLMSKVIVNGCMGTTAGLLLLLYLAPRYGFRITQVAAAAIFFLNTIIILFFILRKRLKTPAIQTAVMTQRVKKTRLWFKKNKAVLETGIKLKHATVRVYAFQGFSATAFLLLYFRILAHYSIIEPFYFQILLIVIPLIGISMGSMLFEKISEKLVNSHLTLATFQIITAFSAVFSYVILYFFHQAILNHSLESDTFNGLLFYQSLLFASLILLPAFTLGLSLPLTGKLYPRRLQDTGVSFGRLGSTWFLSAMTGYILTKFVLIPLAGLYYSYFILVFFVILSGAYLILRDSRLIRGFRLSYVILSVVIYFIIVGAFRTFHFYFPRSGSNGDELPVRKIEGSTTTLSTLEQPGEGESVLLNNQIIFSSDPAGIKEQLMPAYLPMLLRSEMNSALVVGFGMGTTASTLEANGIKSIHITEVFPEVIRFSSDVFADSNDDIITNSHINITIEDARSYLIRLNGKTDLITTGYAQLECMPNNYSKEFYRLCFDKLSHTGLICQILPVDGLTTNEFRSMIKACSDVFPDVSLWHLSSGRLLMVGSKTSIKQELCHLNSEFNKLNKNKGLTSIGIPNLESLIGHMLMDDQQIRKYAETGEANDDNKPEVQFRRMIKNRSDNELLNSLAGTQGEYPDFIHWDQNCNLDGNEIHKRSRKINEAIKQQRVPSSGLQ